MECTDRFAGKDTEKDAEKDVEDDAESDAGKEAAEVAVKRMVRNYHECHDSLCSSQMSSTTISSSVLLEAMWLQWRQELGQAGGSRKAAGRWTRLEGWKP
jgi:hypothetical protein